MLMRVVLTLVGCFLLASCSTWSASNFKPAAPLVGMTLEEVKSASSSVSEVHTSQPKLAIALGGGGLRGYAHIGVLQALEEEGIVPDIVVGTSIGSIIGAAYASGTSPERLWDVAKNMQVNSLADVVFGSSGVIKGEALARWANSLVGNLPIERFPKQYSAVAVDLERSEPIVLMSGDAGQAARASAAIPGIFLPVPYQWGELVDGGVISVVPVRAARAMGADLVIGVDIYCHSPRFSSSTPFLSVLRATQAQSCLLAREEMQEADVLVAPSVTSAGADDAIGRARARKAGYEAGKAAMARLKTMLANSSRYPTLQLPKL